MDIFNQPAEATTWECHGRSVKKPQTTPNNSLEQRMTLGGKVRECEHCFKVRNPRCQSSLPCESRYILVLFQELHCLMLLGVPPHVALQAIHICGGEVTHATSEETTTGELIWQFTAHTVPNPKQTATED